MDSNGDGIGDLPGITSRLDYLKWLGVDAVWISPIYPSPMADFGYDVADYTGIHPLFGSMADFDTLLETAHGMGLKVLLDLVPNHTSEQHPWFIESRSSQHNPKRDWYLWQDPHPEGGPPNNWKSVFGGSGWEWDEKTGQYYYHAFLKEQPDLNWRNPEVQEAMFQAIRFWLDKGVDGFRVDVIWHMLKDDRFRDNPRNPEFQPNDNPYHEFLPVYSTDQPDVHDVIAAMRRMMDEYHERVMIGEIYLPISQLVTYYGVDNRGAHLPFNFQLVVLPWDARVISASVAEYEASLPRNGWPNWVLGNHDKHRIASRVGPGQARVAAMLLLTLRGTPTMYYGDEIGMCDVPIPPDKVQDPQELNVPGLGLGRDPERTPMQWDASANAGFTTGSPWLPIADDYETVNVEAARSDPDSILALYRRLIDLRRAEKALSVGDYTPIEAKGNLIVFTRCHEETEFLIALNLGHMPQEHDLGSCKGAVVMTTHMDREGEPIEGSLMLRADEGLIARLK